MVNKNNKDKVVERLATDNQELTTKAGQTKAFAGNRLALKNGIVSTPPLAEKVKEKIDANLGSLNKTNRAVKEPYIVLSRQSAQKTVISSQITPPERDQLERMRDKLDKQINRSESEMTSQMSPAEKVQMEKMRAELEKLMNTEDKNTPKPRS